MGRGDMSIGVVVGLVIALVVILVILGLLITRFNIFGKGTGELQTETEKRTCAKQSGTCIAGETPCAKEKQVPVPPLGWIDCTATCCKS